MLQTLYDLSGILNRSSEDITEMAVLTSRRLKDFLGAKEVHVAVFRDNTGILKDLRRQRNEFEFVSRRLLRMHSVEAVVPLHLKDRLLGVIILGLKAEGGKYDAEDLKLTDAFARQAALAIDRALLLEEVHLRRQKPSLELERMLVDISHSLQTPLTVVKLELESLKRRLDLSPEIHSFERSIDQFSKFIQDLLSLSVLGARREDMDARRLDLTRLIAELAEYFSVMAEEAGITLAARMDPGIFVAGNKKHLEELVMNLVSNAFKYQRAGGDKKVELFLFKRNSEVVLEVADNGVGIPKEELGRVFTRFYRCGHKLSGDVAGSGLGLAIAKKITENHGGTIAIESESGQGTKVIVVLPLKGAG